MSKERLAEAHWVLERQLAWVAAAEVKVGVIATLQIALLGGLGVAYSTATARSPWAVGFSVFCAVADVASLICASMAIVPRMRGPKASLVFFGRIAERGEADFVDQFARMSDQDLLNDISAQIHCNAKVAMVKHGWVGKAVMLALMSAPPWLCALGVLMPR